MQLIVVVLSGDLLINTAFLLSVVSHLGQIRFNMHFSLHKQLNS